jgi:quercetin dioxygenase-like cupin family protein
MPEQESIKKLEQEGFTDVRICPLPPNQDLPEHTHDEHTVHIILSGELTITDQVGRRNFRPGERIEFPAGTTHKARGTDDGTMITGVKKI